MVVLLYRACTVSVKYLSYLCGVCLSFGLVLHVLQDLVTHLGSQSLLPNHCMNGVGIAKRYTLDLGVPLFCCGLESVEILTNSRGLKQP